MYQRNRDIFDTWGILDGYNITMVETTNCIANHTTVIPTSGDFLLPILSGTFGYFWLQFLTYYQHIQFLWVSLVLSYFHISKHIQNYWNIVFKWCRNSVFQLLETQFSNDLQYRFPITVIWYRYLSLILISNNGSTLFLQMLGHNWTYNISNTIIDKFWRLYIFTY